MAQQNHSIFNIHAKPGGSEIAIQTLQADNGTIKDEFRVRCEEYEARQAQLARIEAMFVVLLSRSSLARATDSSSSIPTTSASETTGSTQVLYNSTCSTRSNDANDSKTETFNITPKPRNSTTGVDNIPGVGAWSNGQKSMMTSPRSGVRLLPGAHCHFYVC